MRNIALAIIVLAVTIPAMADVNITMTRDASNKVTIGYNTTGGNVVRAFALKIDVNNGAFLVDSDEFAGDPNVDDYYVCPGSVSFDVNAGGETYISDFGHPIADQDPCGGVLEIASLYATNDPNHKYAPAGANDLCIFYLDCNAVGFTVGTITLSEDAQRGGVILEDPNEAFTLNLPSPMTICEDCLVVDTNCGGPIRITQTMYNNWVQIGKPYCWCHGGHYMGDASMDCLITATDVLKNPATNPNNFQCSWLKTWPDPNYSPCCDIDNNKSITSTDVLGHPNIPNSGIAPNFPGAVPPPCP